MWSALAEGVNIILRVVCSSLSVFCFSVAVRHFLSLSRMRAVIGSSFLPLSMLSLFSCGHLRSYSESAVCLSPAALLCFALYICIPFLFAKILNSPTVLIRQAAHLSQAFAREPQSGSARIGPGHMSLYSS